MNAPYRRKLIEVALPLEDINREAAREKSIRHGHPSTMHMWWARRPLAACRAVIFASLVDDPSECVADLIADVEKRGAAEKLLRTKLKAWEVAKALLNKAEKAGITAPDPGAEPRLEDLIVETERERIFDIIRELVKWENSNNDRVLNAARTEIFRSCNGKPPPIYDPFCGGGSIPLEAQRLGLEAHASDLNPVPVLINKALIEIPFTFAGQPPVNPEATKKLSASGSWKGSAGLAEDIRYYGKWMRDEAWKRIGHLYPNVKLPKERGGGDALVIAWLWTRTVASPNPAAKGAHVPLVRSFWLFTKAGKKAWIDPVIDQNTMTYKFEVRTGSGEPRSGTVIRSGAVCLLTGSPIPFDYIRAEGKAGRLSERLMAIVAESSDGRIYLSPTEADEEIAKSAQPTDVPETDLPEQALGFRVQAYGMTKHRHLFTDRQLTALTTFCDLVKELRTKVVKETKCSIDYATAITLYLGICASKAAVFYTNLARWRTGEGKSAPAFGRQALPMVWDFTEVNPFAGAGGDWLGIVDGTVRVVNNLPVSPQGTVRQLDASEGASFESGSVFSTDPPYYDNIGYADLSDYFYIWLRRALGSTRPDLFTTVLTPKATELIATPFRHQGNRDAARKFFEEGMSKAFGRMREAHNAAFPLTVYYAFKQSETEDDDEDGAEEGSTATASTGWETMLEAMIQAGLSVTGTWPARTEGGTRLIARGTNALASSVVLVCRARPKDAGPASRRDFLSALKKELPEALRNLQKGNIAPVDLAQAAIGPGMAVFSRYARVVESDGSTMSVRTALAIINGTLDEVLAEQEGEFDAETRWAVAWFEENGFNEGVYGLAETLCTAKNTSVSGMVDSGILAAKGGKVRLLKSLELEGNWDPSTDRRITNWEVVHHLIRTLDQGEDATARLLVRVRSANLLKAEAARDLSYRLYSICERRKRAQDALNYNALVLAWPELTRLAQMLPTEQTVTQSKLL